MEPYIIVLTSLGVIILLTAWLPMALSKLPLSLPIFCVGLGALIFALPGIPGSPPLPQSLLSATERITEIVILVALTGAGLKLDRPLGWSQARGTWMLLLVAMPLTIGGLMLLSHSLLGLGWATSLMLAAALAPTDPVLASDVQVGPPMAGEEDDVRFTLTSEASLNDGFAFPFINLAIAMAVTTSSDYDWLARWALIDVLWKFSAAVLVGIGVGRLLGYLTFKLPTRAKLSRTGDGFVALGMTFVTFGITEMVHAYGFLAVFIAAVAFRSVERNHRYHEKLHDFSEQAERLLMMVLLVLFGGALTGGQLLAYVDWRVAVFAVVTIAIVRPLSAWISLAPLDMPRDEKAVIGFFGIRGVGSFYYLAFALGQARFESPDLLWSVIGLIVVISVVLHGATVTPIMRRLDHRRKRLGRRAQ